MSKKIIFFAFIMCVALAFTQGHALAPAINSDMKDQPKTCQQVWKEWLQEQRTEAKADFKACLEAAGTDKGLRKDCLVAYKETKKEFKKTHKTEKKECRNCTKEARVRYKEGKKAAKEIFKIRMEAATTPEERKICLDEYKKTKKELKTALKEEIKVCFETE
jgi:hypothetical protein